MIATGLERQALACGKWQGIHWGHFHDIALHAHGVQLSDPHQRTARCGDRETLARLQGHEGPGARLSLHDLSNPSVFDLQLCVGKGAHHHHPQNHGALNKMIHLDILCLM